MTLTAADVYDFSDGLKADQDTLASLRRRMPFDLRKRPVADSPDPN